MAFWLWRAWDPCAQAALAALRETFPGRRGCFCAITERLGEHRAAWEEGGRQRNPLLGVEGLGNEAPLVWTQMGTPGSLCSCPVGEGGSQNPVSEREEATLVWVS